ncbi:MAG: hypothetical protein KatS3mg076_3268 [Candidatus Binatia bacterium]|nr:MAG: hypothetical protein KatS3mg076_3268 [Candidatus Binatia bacterium]
MRRLFSTEVARRGSFWLCLAAAVLSSSGCFRSRSSGLPERLNVVLVVVDTLRADRLGCYGARRNTSPALDRLARDAVRFERAYATAPWTKPSVASIFTGLYPSAHGATSVQATLRTEVPTLAELLRKRGYRTYGVVSGLFVAAKYGFRRGFERYDQSEVGGPNHVSTPGVTEKALRFLEEAGEGPFFLFVHYFDPHYTYLRHPEVGFAPPRAGRLEGPWHILRLRQILPTLTPEEVRFLLDLYDEEIRFTDGGIGKLVGALEERNLLDRTLFVVTSDHGEEFLEHGWLGHTRSVYEEVLRVPLIVRVPWRRGPRARLVRTPVSTAALFATILELASSEGSSALPPHHVPSLGPWLRGEKGGGLPLFAEVDFEPVHIVNRAKRAKKKVLLHWPWKLVHDELEERWELYDLERDPFERSNLAEKRKKELAELERELGKLAALARERKTLAPQADLAPEELQQLEDLGYGR